MIESKYNLYYKIRNEIIVYNNRTKKMRFLCADEYEALKESKLDNLSQMSSEQLRKEGFVIALEGLEEEELLKEFAQKIEDNKLNLMILSSSSCNFACKYCYETKRPISIDEQFAKTFLTFIRSSEKKYKSVFIEWFGGEPLLTSEMIIDISQEVKNICKNNKTPFLSSITTNGYYLTYKIFEKLVDANVVYYQITIDGDEKWHNYFRPLKDGGETYKTIIENLISIRDNVSKTKFFKITIRNNICKDNFEACKKFEKTFDALFHEDERFQLFKFPISDWGGEEINKMRDSILEDVDFDYTGINNYRNDLFESIESACCLAAKKNAFVIDAEYQLFKCSHYVNPEQEVFLKNRVGQLNKDGTIDIDEVKNRHWYKKDVDIACRGCQYLPNCLTQCPLSKLYPTESCKEKNKEELFRKIKQQFQRQNQELLCTNIIDLN